MGEIGTRCQFHQHSKSSFSANILVPEKYKPKMQVQKTARETFIQKSCAQNIGEIGSRCQFNQHSKSSFCTNILVPKNTNLQCKYKKAARGTFIRKAACKMLVKLTQGGLSLTTRSLQYSAIQIALRQIHAQKESGNATWLAYKKFAFKKIKNDCKLRDTSQKNVQVLIVDTRLCR